MARFAPVGSMAALNCGEFCCVAKQFDQPFLRLGKDPNVVGDTASPVEKAELVDGERRSSASEGRTGDVAVTTTSTPGPDAMEINLTPTADTTSSSGTDDSDETESEEAATRVRLDEILNAIASTSFGDGEGNSDEMDVDSDARGNTSSGDTGTIHIHTKFPLQQLAHLSHRRERHCRMMLQHASAEKIIQAASSALAASSEGSCKDDQGKYSHDFNLACLLLHNLSIAASVKEPRDDDDRNLDENKEKYRNERLERDGYSRKMLSVVNHETWEGSVRDVFAAIKRLADLELERNLHTSDKKEDVLCVPVQGENDVQSSDMTTSDPEKEHAELCRGSLGTATGCLLALLEPDSARPKLLAMDDGEFIVDLFKTMTSILPKRHGDASLDAVGVIHRILWLRPDATTAERTRITKALMRMETSYESSGGMGARITDTSVPTTSTTPMISTSQQQSPHDEQTDPDDLWDWNASDGYCVNKKENEKFHPFRWHPEFDRRVLKVEYEMQAESVSLNGLIAGLRTHLPPPGQCGAGNGAAGGSVVCTQAVHVLRALFEDLGVLDAQFKFSKTVFPDVYTGHTLWRQLRTTQLQELCMQLACVIETLGHPPPRNEKKEETEEGEGKSSSEKPDSEKSKDSKDSEKDGKPDLSPFSGLWRGFKLTVPKEGQCDGAVGAGMACLNAILHHDVLSSVLVEHPEFDRIANSITRAMASRCSCAWATFSTMFRLAGANGGVAAKRLLTMSSGASLLKALEHATCNRWPAVKLSEMPPATFLPLAPDGGKDLGPVPQKKKLRKKRRRERWREKSPKELWKEAMKERKERKEKKREMDRGKEDQTTETTNDKNETLDLNSDSSDSDDSDSEDDPLRSGTNRLLLRTTAAATLASFAYTQRAWDEHDVGKKLSEYDQESNLDAIDVDDSNTNWLPKNYTTQLGFHSYPPMVQALELWYESRGGDAGGYPSRQDLIQAREGVQKAFAVHRQMTGNSVVNSDGYETDAETPEQYVLKAPIETWWTMRWRESLWKKQNDDAMEDKKDSEMNKDSETNSKNDTDEDYSESISSTPFALDPAVLLNTSWPRHLIRTNQTKKGPLPGGVDPEGILGTVPLLDDILELLSKANSGWDPDTGVAVEAIETLSSDDKARWLLLPETEKVLVCLAQRIKETAALTQEANSNGGTLAVKEEDLDAKQEETKGKNRSVAEIEHDLDKQFQMSLEAANAVARRSGASVEEVDAVMAAFGDADAAAIAKVSKGEEKAHASNSKLKPKKKPKKKKATTSADLCARNALLVHTLYSVTKESEKENEGSAWSVLIDCSDTLLTALHSILTQAREGGVETTKKETETEDDTSKAVKNQNTAATRETVIELCRNVIIVLAEMTDPANSRRDPESGSLWATNVVKSKPWLLHELVMIMRGDSGQGLEETNRSVEGKASVSKNLVSPEFDGGAFTISVEASKPTLAVFGGYPKTSEDQTNTEPSTSKPNSSQAYLGPLAKDCAHIAAAAVFGLLSWDKAMSAFLRSEDSRGGKPAVRDLISRALALLADAVPRKVETGKTKTQHSMDIDGTGELDDPTEQVLSATHSKNCNTVEMFDSESTGGLCGVEAAGLLARMAADDEGRAALIKHAPGIVGYLLPCLDKKLGQTAAFAVRALSGIARGETDVSANRSMTVLERYHSPEKVISALVGMLGDEKSNSHGNTNTRDDPSLDAHVLSEAVVCVATLAQSKQWRWRMLDVLTTSRDEDLDVARKGYETTAGSQLPSRLVTCLAKLLGDGSRPEIVFNVLYCVNCLIGEPPQSWGRGRDKTREEDHVGRRAFVTAASNAQGTPIEQQLAQILADGGDKDGNGKKDASGRNAMDTDQSDGDTPIDDLIDGQLNDQDDASTRTAPDCRLNCTLVVANLAGDVCGRRRLLEIGNLDLLNALSQTLTTAEPERQMLAAYAIGELARPLPGVVRRWIGNDAATATSKGIEDRDEVIDLGSVKNVQLRRSFTKHLPMMDTPDFDPFENGGDPLGMFTQQRQQLFDTMRLVSRNARLGAETVLVSGEANIERWIENGDEEDEQKQSSSDPQKHSLNNHSSYARDYAASQVLRNLPLNIKRKWLLEMLRWELGPVSPGVPVPGLMGVSLTVDRSKPLQDLCKHCDFPNLPPPPGMQHDDTDEESDLESDDDHTHDENGIPNMPGGAFLLPPRGGVSVKFKNEHGEGAALRREWFTTVAENASDYVHGLFTSYDQGVTLHPYMCSGSINPKTHLKYFAALGKVAAVACYHGETFPIRLSDTFLDRVLGRPFGVEDLKGLDPTLFGNKVQYILDAVEKGSAEGDTSTLSALLSSLDLTWSDVADPCGVYRYGEEVQFTLPREKSDTKSKPVTPQNVRQYLRAFVAHRCYASVSHQTAAFAAGFGSVVPPALRTRCMGILTGADLSSLIAGEPGEVNVEDWKQNTAYSELHLAFGFSTQCFWHCLRELLTPQELVGVLQFATGLTSAPAGGFKNLVGYAGDSAPFTIAELTPDKRDKPNSLPMAHACFNTIRLPRLFSHDFLSVETGAEEMARRLRIAVSNGTRGFDSF